MADLDATYRTPDEDADGNEVPCRVTHVRDLPPPAPRIPLTRHLVRVETDGGEETLVRLAVGAAGGTGDRWHAFTLLDNAVLAGIRVARCAGGDHPAQIPRLVGFHDDPVAPFALVEPYVGRPVGELLSHRQLFDEERAAFTDGLFTALGWLAAAGLVHRDIRPGTVRWDPDRRLVQVADLTSATVVGTPRTAEGARPWASHEQREGTGRCDARDDVWSAGMLLFQVLTGHDVEQGARLPLSRFEGVAAGLSGVFEHRADLRPTADDLVERFTGRVPHRRLLDDGLDAGYRRYDERVRRKHRDDQAEPDPRPGDEWLVQPTPGRRLALLLRRYWWAGAVVAGLLAAVAVALTLLLGG